MSDVEPDYKPSRSDRFRPLELIALAAGLALFGGFFVWLATHARNDNPWPLVLIFTGIVFIVSLVVIAMSALAFKPSREELDDLDEQDSPHT